jgi:hypothetical protein
MLRTMEMPRKNPRKKWRGLVERPQVRFRAQELRARTRESNPMVRRVRVLRLVRSAGYMVREL